MTARIRESNPNPKGAVPYAGLVEHRGGSGRDRSGEPHRGSTGSASVHTGREVVSEPLHGTARDPSTLGELITVTVRDRAREAPWGSGLNRPVIRSITISAFCPGCGARRGERRGLNTYDDGENYWVETWKCTARCGHVDLYEAVVKEAVRVASAGALP